MAKIPAKKKAAPKGASKKGGKNDAAFVKSQMRSSKVKTGGGNS